jgi:hypothetical protein
MWIYEACLALIILVDRYFVYEELEYFFSKLACGTSSYGPAQ